VSVEHDARMGAWGHRSFDNDSAQDWLAELGGIRDLRRAFERVMRAKPTAYIEVDDASAVIAAAEIVAAARGHAMKGAPEEIASWLDEHARKLTATDAKLAKQAVVRVQTSSELQELWSAHGARNPWMLEVKRLLARLAKPAKAKSDRRSTTGKKGATRRVRRPAIQVLTGAEVRSPDGQLVASVSGVSTHAMRTVIILEGGDGGSVVAVWCDLDAVGLHWHDNETLEVSYPNGAKLEGERDDSWFLCGRTVAVRYKLT